MSNAIYLPPPSEIVSQIESRRKEIDALKKLLRASKAAQQAQAAREQQIAFPEAEGESK